MVTTRMYPEQVKSIIAMFYLHPYYHLAPSSPPMIPGGSGSHHNPHSLMLVVSQLSPSLHGGT
jgi:hypothetical protein